MKSSIFLTIIIVFKGLYLFGQSNSPTLPQIIPASPTAQTFMRYGEIPVDYSTGVPNIEIPIYTLEGRQLKVPISISYHASGIKVNDIASEAGLGWALNCGGMISRTVNGRRDELNAARTYFNSEQLMNAVTTNASYWNSSCACLEKIMNFEDFFNNVFDDAEDPMNDRYFYRLPGGTSGVFTYDYDDIEEGDNSVVTLPYRPYKIKKHVVNEVIDNFEITDDNGIVYEFRPFVGSTTNRYSEWLLTKMISADGTDEISFNYIAQPGYSLLTTSFAYQGHAQYDPTGCLPENSTSSLNTSTSSSPDFATPVLESVISSKAIVKFEYASREDFSVLKRLTEITIASVNSPSQIIKRVSFHERYFGSAAAEKRLGLDNIVISATGSQPQQYSFTYETQILPPYPYKMVSPRYNEDFWGYYNGGNSNTLIPFDFIPSQYDRQAYGANRDPDNGYFSKACMLKEVKYPMGGRTVFEFERGNVGGFRVKSIINYTDESEIANVKTYEYPEAIAKPINEVYFGYDQMFAKKTYTGGTQFPDDYCWATFTRKLRFSSPVLPFDIAPGNPVVYTKVIEYNGTILNHAGKTEYRYYQPYSPSDYYSNPEHPFEHEAEWYYHPYHYDKGNYVPRLSSKTEYSFDGANYHVLFAEDYVYEDKFTKSFNTGIKLSRRKVYGDPTYFVFSGCASAGCDLTPVINDYIASIVAINTRAYQEASILTRVNTHTYDPLDDTKYVLTTTDYTYNESNLAIREKTTESSKGEQFKTTYLYPVDNSAETVYSNMVGRNIIKPIIEQSTFKVGGTNTLISSVKTTFGFWDGNDWVNSPADIVVHKTVEEKISPQTNYEVRLRYHAYDDRGNVTSVSKEDDVKKTYLWGYNRSYPVAEITNADYSTSIQYVDQNILDNPADDATLRNHLNNLRNISGALVSTYTYKPLIGMTSKTDINNRTTYYEYDELGRLSLVRDHDGNVLEKICYNLKGQQENCIRFSSEDRSGNYYSQICAGGETPDPYYVSVPAGMFSSTISQADANAQAVAYAQQQADQYGTCQSHDVPLYYDNTTWKTYFVGLYNTSSGQNYSFLMPNNGGGGGLLGSVPSGTYDVHFSSPEDTDFRIYVAGCGFEATGYGDGIIYGVTIEAGCNMLEIW